MNKEKLRELFKDNCLIEKLYYYEEIGSTNDEAKKIGRQNPIKSALVLANYQTDGKGRLGRDWSMPKDKDLMFSLLLKPSIDIADAPRLTLVMCQAIVNVFRYQVSKDIWVKWPNDIIFSGRKVCGILTEMSCEQNRIKHIVLGVGINCNSDSFSEELQDKAISLKQILGCEIIRETLLLNIVEEFNALYRNFISNGLTNIISSIRECSFILGRDVYIIRNNTNTKAKAVDITDFGELVVQHENGYMEVLVSGEVSVRGIYGYT